VANRKIVSRCFNDDTLGAGPLPVRSQAEVAALAGVSLARVKELETRALRKMAKSPVLKQLAEDLGIVPPEEDADEE